MICLLILLYVIYNLLFFTNLGLIIKAAINRPEGYCYFYKFGKNLLIGNYDDNE